MPSLLFIGPKFYNYHEIIKKGFEDALNKAIESKKVCLLEVRIDRMESVLPMVPTNAPLDKMILE